MRTLELDTVFVVNGRLAIKLVTFAKLLHYSSIYLLRLVKALIKKGIKIGFKWRKEWYIFLPSIPLKSIIQNANGNKNNDGGNEATTPSGDSINTDWESAIEELPPGITDNLERTNFNIVIVDNRLVVPISSSTELVSSSLNSKKLIDFTPSNLGSFPATTDYKYGYYIHYDPTKMSTFDPGTAGTLKSTQLPQALFEVSRALDAAENLRNGANPGLPPRRNLSTTVSFDTGTIAIAATLPISAGIQTGGSVGVTVSDYLGSTYSAFAGGSGDLTSDTLPEALLEIASLLAAAEKAVTPAENQPNNVQIVFDLETSSATISANLPFTTAAGTTGNVVVIAIDYL
ncbi:hypothetical protein [Nostoc sp. NMS4]|uniref:hypothetical protein n=1 Tax=Nostoc sp. NMS4 TaxID=2815390 RepID=UPI0025D6A889|nr:hypothetical protein [Nostoc sp. NMS4]MBN3924006.1 hypothetical protein [Nostoc sp. NMS4]